MTRRVICAVAHKYRIKPYPFLNRVQPFVLKLFLADGTHVIDPTARFWHWDILWGIRVLGRLR